MEKSKKALLIGASGLVGNFCLHNLLNDSSFIEVEVWVRKSLEINHPKLVERIVDFSTPESYTQVRADVVFCCLGTTMANAGSKGAFREVDFWNVVRVAKSAKQSGSAQFLCISSIGANIKSSSFYLKTKGEMEKELVDLNFNALHILRPSILLGNRKEFRLGEVIGKGFIKVIGFLLVGKFRKYRGIEASKVAETMIAISKTGTEGVKIWESNEIQDFQ